MALVGWCVNQHSSYRDRLIALKLQLPRTGGHFRGSRWETHLLKAILLMQMKADGISTSGNTGLWRDSEHPASFNDPFNALVILPFSHNSTASNIQETYCLQGRVFLRWFNSNNLSFCLFSVASMIFAGQKIQEDFNGLHQNPCRIWSSYVILAWKYFLFVMQ